MIKNKDIVSDRVEILNTIKKVSPFINEINFSSVAGSLDGKKPKNRISVIYNKDKKVTTIVYG